jgi:hypothetical protein
MKHVNVRPFSYYSLEVTDHLPRLELQKSPMAITETQNDSRSGQDSEPDLDRPQHSPRVPSHVHDGYDFHPTPGMHPVPVQRTHC